MKQIHLPTGPTTTEPSLKEIEGCQHDTFESMRQCFFSERSLEAKKIDHESGPTTHSVLGHGGQKGKKLEYHVRKSRFEGHFLVVKLMWEAAALLMKQHRKQSLDLFLQWPFRATHPPQHLKLRYRPLTSYALSC